MTPIIAIDDNIPIYPPILVSLFSSESSLNNLGSTRKKGTSVIADIDIAIEKKINAVILGFPL